LVGTLVGKFHGFGARNFRPWCPLPRRFARTSKTREHHGHAQLRSFWPPETGQRPQKVKINGVWKLRPAVIEANGKLRDRVKVSGTIEVYLEGGYYLEWRVNGKKVRESVPEKNDVLRRARLRALELNPDARDKEIAIPDPEPAISLLSPTNVDMPAKPASPAGPADSLSQAVESYIQNALLRVFGSHLGSAPILTMSQPDPPRSELQAAWAIRKLTSARRICRQGLSRWRPWSAEMHIGIAVN